MIETLRDTDPETEQVHLELIRAASPERRLQLALSLSDTVIALARANWAQTPGDASAAGVGIRLVGRLYGESLAAEVRTHLLSVRS